MLLRAAALVGGAAAQHSSGFDFGSCADPSSQFDFDIQAASGVGTIIDRSTGRASLPAASRRLTPAIHLI
jgi:hypothetical protein